ncbi:FAD-dependent oxidoreductase [Microbacterium sp.]|uniref:FAD-dependent oxidoreductase n=1 Tax=Microbacterium sp. TaxID=51671 RepID=UPI003C732A76
MTHIAIIGGGPAGLAAAEAALSAGARVTLLDEGTRLGGQFWRHAPGITNPKMQHELGAFDRLTTAVSNAAASNATPSKATVSKATVHSGANVWHIERDESTITVHAVTGEQDGTDRTGLTVTADRLIIATGAHDLALPIPGSTLPGVTTAGAAQALAKRDGVTVGKRTVVAGAGPFLLPVAQSLTLAGAEVVGVYEASGIRSLATGWAPKPWQLAGKAGEFLEYVTGMLRSRTGYHPGTGVVRILGDDRVTGVVVAKLDATWAPIAGTEQAIECDSVALGHGFTPRLEAAIMIGCDIVGDRGGRFVRVDQGQRTTVPGVYAAGELTGIGGADAAQTEGALAGFVAAGVPTTDARIRRLVAQRAKWDYFARRLRVAHGIQPGWTHWLTDDTVVCRCEAVTTRTLTDHASAAPRAFKLATRAGLGPCQGRTCGIAVEHIVAAAGGDVDGAFHKRPVLSPVRLGELTNM